jgi:hypothetical protein
MARLGIAIFLGLSLVGVASLFGFRGLRLDFLQKPHGTERAPVVVRTGTH